MRSAVLFIAMSLDGYIADAQGGVSWLGGQDPSAETLDTYSTFIQDVDTVVMGWNTYHQIVTELSPAEWVYRDLTSYVITHRRVPSADSIIFTETNPVDLIRDLKRRPGKRIWICGGANLVHQLLKADLIDEYRISVIPTLLGAGIRLFEPFAHEIKLELLQTQTTNGITELHYVNRQVSDVLSI